MTPGRHDQPERARDLRGAVLAAALSALASTPAAAQTTDASDPPQAGEPPAAGPANAAAGTESIVLEDIVVTGQKFDRDFKNTFSSVGVVTGEEIQDLRVNDLKDSFRLLANVRSFEANRGNNGFVIRGINSDGVTQPTNNAPVTSLIIDGATQSVESTRRGARGVWDLQQVEVFRGPQSTLQGRGALAGAVLLKTNDPTFFWEGRLFGALGQDDRRDGAFVVSGPLIRDQVAFRVSGEARQRDFDITFSNPDNEVVAEDRYRNIRGKLLIQPTALPDLSVLLTASSTYDHPGVRAVNSADFFDREFNTAPNTAVEIREADNRNYIAEIGYQLGDGLELTSISALVRSDTFISTPQGIDFQRDENRSGEDFTQDLRLTIGEEGDRLTGVVGGFYGRFTLPRDSLVTNAGAIIQDLTSDDRTTSTAVYADLRYELLDGFNVIGGLRYQHETVKNESTGTSIGQIIDIDESADFDVFLPKFGLSYELTDIQTIAFTAQRGYRSGFTEVAAGEVNTVDPEFLWSYEIAWRAESPDGRWRLGATGFYYDYTDQQIAVLIDGGPLTQTLNAGTSRAFGAEIEGAFVPTPGLRIFGSLGLLDTEFTDLQTATGDFTGNAFPEAPAVTASLGTVYRHDSGFFASADVSFTDSYFSSGSIENDPALKIGTDFVAGVRLGWEGENYSIIGYVDNLFDRKQLTSLNNNGRFGTDPLEATIADGRRVGAELTLFF